jgi:hypothetical protein
VVSTACWAGITHYAPHPGFQAPREQPLLPVARAQQIEAAAHVRMEEALLVKRRFTGGLNTAEKYELHSV